MKSVICLFPGITDRALDDLAGLTPLQKAETPHLDRLAACGDLFAVTPPEHGGFATAFLGFLGGDVSQPLPAGPLEACALGFRPSPSQVAYSVRLVSIGQGTIVDVSDQLVSEQEARELFRSLNRAFGSRGLHFLPLAGPRGVLISSDATLQEAKPCLGLNPIDTLNTSWEQWLPGYQETLEALQANLAQHEINALREDLEERPINGILLYDGGTLPKLDHDGDAWLSTLSCLTKQADLEGVAKLCEIPHQRLSAEEKKFDNVPKILEFVGEGFAAERGMIVEVPYLWDATYAGDLRSKIKTLEWLDTHLIEPLATLCQESDALLTFFPLKHCDITTGRSVPGPVPTLVCRPGSGQAAFHEGVIESLPQISQSDLLEMSLNLECEGLPSL